MRGMDLVCFKLDADEVHTGTEEPDDSWFARAAPWFMGADYVAPPAGQPPPPRPPPPPPGSNALYLEYGTAVELEEETYTSTTGSEYPGGGYIVKNSKDLYQRHPNLKSKGCMRTCGSHMRVDSQSLMDIGWLDPTTRGIFHDYTVCERTHILPYRVILGLPSLKEILFERYLRVRETLLRETLLERHLSVHLERGLVCGCRLGDKGRVPERAARAGDRLGPRLCAAD